jgi:hypothetical protein
MRAEREFLSFHRQSDPGKKHARRGEAAARQWRLEEIEKLGVVGCRRNAEAKE